MLPIWHISLVLLTSSVVKLLINLYNRKQEYSWC